MTEETKEVVKKKRGRRPKNYYISKSENINQHINSEDEKVILHLPININTINNNCSNNNSTLNFTQNNVEYSETSIFIKHEMEKSVDSLTASDNNKDNIVINNINRIISHTINTDKNTKCWWCRYSFKNDPIQLPENYLNNIFYCIGHFCSFNCAKSFNIYSNDSNMYKRESLLNFMYYVMYDQNIYIKQAPHWLTLKDYGGILSIDEFRENFNIANKDYVILNPPIMSRKMQIEESYKIDKLKEVHINKLNKIYSEINSDYVIKRTKKMPLSELNLENTMGIKRVLSKN